MGHLSACISLHPALVLDVAFYALDKQCRSYT